MSEREMRRAAVFAQVKRGSWKLVEAAERMDLSYRQAKRLEALPEQRCAWTGAWKRRASV
jgi:hypothetical protein